MTPDDKAPGTFDDSEAVAAVYGALCLVMGVMLRELARIDPDTGRRVRMSLEATAASMRTMAPKTAEVVFRIIDILQGMQSEDAARAADLGRALAKRPD